MTIQLPCVAVKVCGETEEMEEMYIKIAMLER
jgi:hypothetical protein